jgi:hypothetical protein
MKRSILGLTVTLMMLIGSALPALTPHETGDTSGEPRNP